MSQDNNRKGMQGGLLLLLVAAIFLVLTMQNLSESRRGKVSFSHQVEHLVNLDMVKKDKSVKTSMNDNLVTFSGQFKDALSQDATKRYRYLELLNSNHKLSSEKLKVYGELSQLKQNVYSSSLAFAELAGIDIPRKGLSVVSSRFNISDFESGVNLVQRANYSGLSLKEIEMLYAKASHSPSASNVKDVGEGTLSVLQKMRSPQIGIGVERFKKALSDEQKNVENALASNQGSEAKLAVFQNAIVTLQNVTREIAQEKDGVRFFALRSVRSYVENLERFETLSVELERNTAELTTARAGVSDVTWFFNNRELTTKALERQDPETYEQWFQQAQNEWQGFATNQGLSFKAPDQPTNIALQKTFKSQEQSPNYFSYFVLTILPVLSVVLLLYFFFSRQVKGSGASAMSFGKSPAKMLHKSALQVTFKDVAGVEEAKEELEEIVDFLKDPTRFTALGARIPRGVLCVGPPGTGKTLIAKAVAGEADRPFFSISGSDFVEMFVGVGASRIRDLFEQAKKQAPCIVFIDEIDAVGRHRGAGIGGGHDEREQTLNQLLVEMDGMNTNEGIILMAATNRPDVLDKALLRPGRFDRRVTLELPDVKGRLEILKVHARKIKLSDDVDLSQVAKQTPGASGADLMNILNEAALLAARKGRKMVTHDELMGASDKVRFGKERRSLQLEDEEKKTTAYHEAGHAIVGLVVENSDPVEKVTIIPRGMSLGATHFVPKSNRVSYWRKELTDQLAVLMGGRVAEEQFIGDVCSGAQMDILQATRLARSMVCEWGMTDKLGMVAYDENTGANRYLGGAPKESHYSEETSRIIDEEVKKLIDEGYQLATKVLTENREKVDLMARCLIDFETLDQDDVRLIMEDKWSDDDKRKKLDRIDQAHKPPPPPKDLHADPGVDPTPQGA